MKNKISILLISLTSFSLSQTLNTLPTNASNNGQNANPKAYCGIGTAQLLPIPNQNLHIHGVSSYTRGNDPGKFQPGPIEGGGEIGGGGNGGSPLTINYGVTSAINLTNSLTGITSGDGALLRMSQKELAIENMENDGSLSFSVGPANLRFSGLSNTISTGANNFSINGIQARFNIWGGNTNALHLRSTTGGNALTIQGPNAIQVYGLSNTIQNFTVSGQGDVFARTIEVLGFDAARNFRVTGTGEVYGRKFTTTLQNIPDYVFENNYQLMPLTELKTYLAINKHLPNIPSATEIEANEGQVDLGEMNRLLLEKVEESMLYILQLEERINALEEK